MCVCVCVLTRLLGEGELVIFSSLYLIYRLERWNRSCFSHTHTNTHSRKSKSNYGSSWRKRLLLSLSLALIGRNSYFPPLVFFHPSPVLLRLFFSLSPTQTPFSYKLFFFLHITIKIMRETKQSLKDEVFSLVFCLQTP